MSIRWRKYLNWSLLTLSILALWLGWFVYLETQVGPGPAVRGEVSFYVVEESRGYFNDSRYTVLVGRELWRVEDVSLRVGREYRAAGEGVEFDLAKSTSYERYLRGGGVRGRLKVDSGSLRLNRHCDWICRGLSFVHENRYRAGRLSQEFACHTGYERWSRLYYTDVTCGDVSSLVTGLTYGDVSGMSAETKEVVRKFGLSHLVAVSGFQVVLVAGFLEVWLRRLRVGFGTRTILTIAGLLGLGIFTGLQPPIVRSLLSAFVIVLARVLGRRCSQRRALFFSAGLMLWAQPDYIFSISFQLSCLATWALLETRFVRAGWNYLLAPVNAFLYTLPVIISFAGGVSPVGVVANIVFAGVVPLVTYLCILGFVPGVGELFLSIANLVILLTLNVLSDWSAGIDLVALEPMRGGEVGAYYVGLYLINRLLRRVLNAVKKSPAGEMESGD